MKKLIILIIVGLLNFDNAMANSNLPVIKYPADSLMFLRKEKINPKYDSDISPNSYYGDVFIRPLIFKTEQGILKQTLASYGNFVKIVKKDLPQNFSKQYRLISIMPKSDENGVLNLIKKQGCILVKNEIVGYYMLSPVNVELPDTDPTYTKIKSLSLNLNYLSNKYTVPQGNKIMTYETVNDGFIERYITLKHGQLEYLLGEMFYPKELDGQFDSKIIDAINTYTYRIDKSIRAEDNPALYLQIQNEFKTPLGDTEY